MGISLVWHGGNNGKAGLLNKEGLRTFFSSNPLKLGGEKPLHRLIKDIIYENPEIFSENPFLTAKEVAINAVINDGKGNNVKTKLIGSLDVMILEKDELDSLKGLFIEVKSSLSIKARVEALKGKDIGSLNEYLKQVAKHIAALQEHFIFSSLHSRYYLVYPLRGYDAFNELYHFMSSSRTPFELLKANVSSYLGCIEILPYKISIINLRTMQPTRSFNFNLFRSF
jgi:hypothetical protein